VLWREAGQEDGSIAAWLCKSPCKKHRGARSVGLKNRDESHESCARLGRRGFALELPLQLPRGRPGTVQLVNRDLAHLGLAGFDVGAQHQLGRVAGAIFVCKGLVRASRGTQ